MPKPTKKSSFDRVLSLSITPKKDVTTVPSGRTFFVDVNLGEDGQPFFFLNSAFANKEPKEQVRLLRAMKDKKVFCNVFVNKETTFTPFSAEGSPRKPQKAKGSSEPVADVDDLDEDDSDEDFDY